MKLFLLFLLPLIASVSAFSVASQRSPSTTPPTVVRNTKLMMSQAQAAASKEEDLELTRQVIAQFEKQSEENTDAQKEEKDE